MQKRMHTSPTEQSHYKRGFGVPNKKRKGYFQSRKFGEGKRPPRAKNADREDEKQAEVLESPPPKRQPRKKPVKYVRPKAKKQHSKKPRKYKGKVSPPVEFDKPGPHRKATGPLKRARYRLAVVEGKLAQFSKGSAKYKAERKKLLDEVLRTRGLTKADRKKLDKDIRDGMVDWANT